MPTYNPNLLISDCYGSAGSITFYHRNGKCRWRSKSTLSFAATPGQSAALDVHRRALAAWRTIPDTDKEKWHEIARNVPPHRPPFGSDGHISGHNLFVSAYHGFHTLGNEHIPGPVAFRPFPVFVAGFMGAKTVSTSDLRIALKLSMPEADNPAGYALLCKVQLTEAGKGSNPGKMRNFLAEDVSGSVSDGMSPEAIKELTETVEVRTVAITIPDYRTFSGTVSDSYSLHIRYMLIDRTTGYRSRYQKLSAQILIVDSCGQGSVHCIRQDQSHH